MKARKEIQKRSFWRRFFSSFLSLLKEKRPSETKGERIATGAMRREASTLGVRPRNDSAGAGRALWSAAEAEEYFCINLLTL